MAKTEITLVDIRDDKSVIVFYSSGTCRPYKSMDTLPKTALAWLEAHPQQEPVRFVATDQGVITEQITEQEEKQPFEIDNIGNRQHCRFLNSAEPVQLPQVISEHITEQAQEEVMELTTVEDKTTVGTITEQAEPIKVVISPIAAVMLAGLAIARAGVFGAMAAVRVLGLLAAGTEIMIRAVNKAWWTIYPPTARTARIWTDKARIWAAESWQFRETLLNTNLIGEPLQ